MPRPVPDDDPDHRAEDGEDHGLRTDHGPDLPASHADRPEEADLVRPFEHREHQRVHDADEGDDDGKAE